MVVTAQKDQVCFFKCQENNDCYFFLKYIIHNEFESSDQMVIRVFQREVLMQKGFLTMSRKVSNSFT